MRTLIAKTIFFSSVILAVGSDFPLTQSDAVFRQKIVGTWIIEVGRTNEAFWARGTETYYSNDCFVVQAKVFLYGKTKAETHGGIWHINNGILIAANTNIADLKAGSHGSNWEKCKLIRIDEHEMVHYVSSKHIQAKVSDVVTLRRLE